MKNKRTGKGLFLLGIILVFVLAGCIDSNSADDGSGGSKSSEAKITSLTLTISGEDHVIDLRSGTTAEVELLVSTTIPDSATVKSVTLSPGASGLAQGSKVDIVNNVAKITITAEDGMTKVEYTVTVTIEPLSAYSLSYPIAFNADNTMTASPVFWKDGAMVSTVPGVSYAVEPMLPNGLELNADTGTITGTMPVTEKATVYTITATEATSITAIFLDKFLLETYTQVATGTAIGSLDALKTMDAAGEYYLTDHIDLAEETWEPLFTEDAPFTGTLRGNGYAIYNLRIEGLSADTDGGNYQGLFAAIGDGASIENLGIGVKDITGNAAVGALAGLAGQSAVTLLDNIAVAPTATDAKIQSTGTVKIDSADAAHLGGMVGYMKSGELKGYNLGLQVTSNADSVGGLVGTNLAAVSGYATGNVSGAERAGGLVGRNAIGIVSGYATGTVTGTAGNGYYIGGLVGDCVIGTVSGYATGNVTGVQQVGGLVGGISSGGSAFGYATGSVEGDSKVGGLIGYNDNSTVIGYATGSVKGTTEDGGLVGLSYNGGEGRVSGYWDIESTGKDTSAGGVAIRATRDIVFDSDAKTYTDSGRTIFDITAFTDIFNTANGASATWPKLKSTYKFNDIDFTFVFPQPTVSDTDGDGVIDLE